MRNYHCEFKDDADKQIIVIGEPGRVLIDSDGGGNGRVIALNTPMACELMIALWRAMHVTPTDSLQLQGIHAFHLKAVLRLTAQNMVGHEHIVQHPT